jgi:hypothetical protein
MARISPNRRVFHKRQPGLAPSAMYDATADRNHRAHHLHLSLSLACQSHLMRVVKHFFCVLFFQRAACLPVCDLRVFILAADGAIFSLHKASQADGGLFVHFFVWSLHKNVLFVTRICCCGNGQE